MSKSCSMGFAKSHLTITDQEREYYQHPKHLLTSRSKSLLFLSFFSKAAIILTLGSREWFYLFSSLYLKNHVVSIILFLPLFTIMFLIFTHIIICSLLFFFPLYQVSANFSLKSPIANIFSLGCHKDSVTTTHLCCYNTKAARQYINK